MTSYTEVISCWFGERIKSSTLVRVECPPLLIRHKNNGQCLRIMAFQLREIFMDGNKFKCPRGHAAALKFGSTVMPHSLSSHSGM